MALGLAEAERDDPDGGGGGGGGGVLGLLMQMTLCVVGRGCPVAALSKQHRRLLPVPPHTRPSSHRVARHVRQRASACPPHRPLE